MRNLFNYFLKVLLLSTCSGICLSFFIVLYTVAVDPVFFYETWRWSNLSEIILFFLIGFFIGLIIGIPSLFIIDKFFTNTSGRYILGGVLAASIIWIYLTSSGIPTTPFISLAPGPLNWPLLIIFIEIGASTGALYTVALRCFITKNI